MFDSQFHEKIVLLLWRQLFYKNFIYSQDEKLRSKKITFKTSHWGIFPLIGF